MRQNNFLLMGWRQFFFHLKFVAIRENNLLMVGGANKIFTLSQSAPSTTRKLFCLAVTWRGVHLILFEMAVTVGRILTFPRAKLLKIEFLIEILTI